MKQSASVKMENIKALMYAIDVELTALTIVHPEWKMRTTSLRGLIECGLDSVIKLTEDMRSLEALQKTLQVREHRGSLDESMKTLAKIEPTHAALIAHILKSGLPESLNTELQRNPYLVRVEPYRKDDRLDWNTHIVSIVDYGVWGFTDGALVE